MWDSLTGFTQHRRRYQQFVINALLVIMHVNIFVILKRPSFTPIQKQLKYSFILHAGFIVVVDVVMQEH
jgi:hypothetical protein